MKLLVMMAAAGGLFMLTSCSGVSKQPKAFGPPSVTAKCDDVLIRIDGSKIFTPSRIEYKGTVLGIEDSAYGTVLKFPGIGFLGTAHFLDRPDGKEAVKKLDFYIDGRKIATPPEQVECRRFKLHKVSKIFDIDLDSTVEVRGSRLYETAVISTDKKVPLEIMYNFMHAWTPSALAVLARSRNGDELDAKFDDAGRKELALRDLDWAAVYDANSGKGAVSCLLASPKVGSADLLIVNAPKVYRKYYVKSFVDQPLDAGFHGTYKMVTAFFQASPEHWRIVARATAASLCKQ